MSGSCRSSRTTSGCSALAWFEWCNTSVRAEPYPFGADAYVDLELYLAWRALGLPVETPAVRR